MNSFIFIFKGSEVYRLKRIHILLLTFGSVFQTAPLLDTLAVVKLKNSELILPHYYIHFVQNTSNTVRCMRHHCIAGAPILGLKSWLLVIWDKYSACTAIHVTQQSSVDWSSATLLNSEPVTTITSMTVSRCGWLQVLHVSTDHPSCVSTTWLESTWGKFSQMDIIC